MFKSDPGLLTATLHPPAIPPAPSEGEGEMSMASPPAHSTWAGVVKGQPPPVVSPGPSPPAARLLQLYRDCVARGTWARLCFDTKGGEEELSFSCRVGGAATGASKKQGRPANERRKERARRRRRAWEERRRRRAWEERRRRPAAEGAAAATAAPGAASQTGEVVSSWSSSRQQEQQPSKGEPAIGRSSSRRQEQQLVQELCTYSQQPLAGAASVVGAAVVSSICSSSLWQEQQPLAGASVAVAADSVVEP